MKEKRKIENTPVFMKSPAGKPYKGLSAFPAYATTAQRMQVLASGSPLQAKQAVSSQNDPAEIEAERLTGLVMQHLPEGGGKWNRSRISPGSRKTGTRTRRREPLSPLNESGERGTPLTPELRQLMEQRFGVNFGSIRLHNDSESHSLNHSLASQAFLLGDDIYFGQGKFEPGSEPGKRIIAHELAHVVQPGRKKDIIYPFRLPIPEFLGLPDIYLEPIPHTHPLSPCVNQPVTHIGLVVRKKTPLSTGKGKILLDLHLGFYRDNITNRVCFVIFESKKRLICFKLCFPNREDLKQAWQNIRDAIVEVLENLFLLLGIAVAAWVIYLIAEALATALIALLAVAVL